jgi:hypothetical protein
MKIDSLRDLKKLLQLCRQQGVQSIKLGEIEFHLGNLPTVRKSQTVNEEVFPEELIQVPQFTPVPANTVLPTVAQTVQDQIETDELSEDQLLFYSAQGHTDQANQ